MPENTTETANVRDKLRKVLDGHVLLRSAMGGVVCDGLTECDWLGDDGEQFNDHLADELTTAVQPFVDCAAGIAQAAEALDRLTAQRAEKETPST